MGEMERTEGRVGKGGGEQWGGEQRDHSVQGGARQQEMGWRARRRERRVRGENLLLNLQTVATHLLFSCFRPRGREIACVNRTAPFPHDDPPPCCNTLRRPTGPVQIRTATPPPSFP